VVTQRVDFNAAITQVTETAAKRRFWHPGQALYVALGCVISSWPLTSPDALSSTDLFACRDRQLEMARESIRRQYDPGSNREQTRPAIRGGRWRHFRLCSRIASHGIITDRVTCLLFAILPESPVASSRADCAIAQFHYLMPNVSWPSSNDYGRCPRGHPYKAPCATAFTTPQIPRQFSHNPSKPLHHPLRPATTGKQIGAMAYPAYDQPPFRDWI